MRLEDALLQLVIGPGSTAAGDLVETCRAAVQAGSDLIRLPASVDKDVIAGVLAVCREEDALLVVEDDLGLCNEVGCDGLHLTSERPEVGYARATLGPGRLLGVTSSTVDETRVAVELNPDYVVQEGGIGCCADFPSLGRVGGVELFAGGLGGTGDARELVTAGIFRLCVMDSILESGEWARDLAEY